MLTLVAIVFAVVARVVLLRSSLGALNSDEAVVGLMAEHVLHGEHPTFYWGQAYGGTIEVYLVAALFRAFGPGTLGLKLVPILLWTVAAVLVWRVASRFVPRPQARLVGALFWALPAYSVWKSEHEEGYYGVLLVCGVLIVLTALVLAERGASLLGVAILGLLCGLGWWSSPQIAILAVPSIVWLAGRRGFAVRAWAFAPGFVVGALPWLLANVGRGWPSLHDRTAGSTWLDRLHALVSVTLPTALGLRVPYSLDWIPDTVIGAALYAAALAGVCLVALRRRRELALPLIACATFPLIYVASPYTWINAEPRYFVLLFPIMILLLVGGPRRNATVIVLSAGALALSGSALAVMGSNTAALPHIGGVVVPARFDGLISALDEHRVTRVYADYWVAFRLSFESDERIVAAPSKLGGFRTVAGTPRPLDDSEGRWPPYTRAVRAAPEPAVVFVVGDRREPAARRVLVRAGYRRTRVDDFDVFLPASRGPGG